MLTALAARLSALAMAHLAGSPFGDRGVRLRRGDSALAAITGRGARGAPCRAPTGATSENARQRRDCRRAEDHGAKAARVMTLGMGALAAILMLAAAARPAAAGDCVTPQDLKRPGILVTMSDGKVWHARSAGKKGVRQDQANGRKGEDEIIEGPYGIYEVLHARRLVRTGDQWGQIERRFAGRPPAPVAGKDWTSPLQEDWGNFAGTGRGPDYGGKVHYRFLPVTTVNLGACSYDILTVEATFTGTDRIAGGSLNRSDRWTYFADLKFGVRTQSRDGVTGKVTRADINALSVAR